MRFIQADNGHPGIFYTRGHTRPPLYKVKASTFGSYEPALSVGGVRH